MTTTTATGRPTCGYGSPSLHPGIASSSLIFETYSLFYRSRKDVRQLKDSFDLLCGRMARRCDGSRMMVVAPAGDGVGRRTSGWLQVRQKTVSHVHGIAGTPDIVLYRRSTKDAFSYAHKRPRSRRDIPRAVYYRPLRATVSRGDFGVNSHRVLRFDLILPITFRLDANATAISGDSPASSNHLIYARP